jgi:hypothetical protein
MATHLKELLRQRHFQTYEIFCIEYEKEARKFGPAFGAYGQYAPSRSQFFRWTSGALKDLPHPHHCGVGGDVPGMDGLPTV